MSDLPHLLIRVLMSGLPHLHDMLKNSQQQYKSFLKVTPLLLVPVKYKLYNSLSYFYKLTKN